MREAKNENLKKQFEIVFSLAEKIHDEKRKIEKEFSLTDENSFNILSLVVNDDKYLEKFHDRALFAILNPKTQNIGNTVFLEKFLEVIGVDCKDFSPLDETIVEKKKRTYNKSEDIDIFIYNEKNKNAIIIEDKLYDAKDQPNQLARYYKYVTEEMRFNVSKIVYLPLTPSKEPNKQYDGEYKKYTERIEKLLKILPAVSHAKDDIVRAWLEKIDWDNVSYRNENNKNLAQVFVSQYKNLLLGLGEDELMADFEKDIIREIYSSKKNIDAIKIFYEKFDKGLDSKIITNYFAEEIYPEICKELASKGYEKHDEVWCLKPIDNTKLYFGVGNESEIAIYKDSKMNREEKKKCKDLFEAIKESEQEDIFYIYDNDNYVSFNLNEWSLTWKDTKKWMLNMLEKLENAY